MTAVAQEQPTTGLLYNTVENHSQTYDCRPDGPEVECSFVQTAVRRKAKPEDLQERLQKARSEFLSFKADLSKQCQGVEAGYEAFALGRPPSGVDLQKFTEGTAKLHPAQKAGMGKLFTAFREVCRAPNEAKYLDLMRLSHDRETRTCIVSSYAFKQRFRRVESRVPGL